MSADGPQKEDDSTYDVVVMHGPTDDGEGTRVLRARPGRVEPGEVRPMREGRPVAAGGEIVRLEQRADAPALFDVHVDYVVPAAVAPPKDRPQDGPPQVATPAYRENWELTFGSRKDGHRALN
jgi:hypothetical protein